jgi:hypothetical protein
MVILLSENRIFLVGDDDAVPDRHLWMKTS